MVYVLIVFAVLALVFFLLPIDGLYDAPRDQEIPVSDAAKKLHERAITIDCHCDCMLWDRDLTRANEHGHLDFPRMKEGGLDAQIITLASGGVIKANAIRRLWPLRTWCSNWAQMTYQIDGVARQLDSQVARLAVTAAEVRENQRGVILSIVHGIEGAHALDKDDVSLLERAAQRGVVFCGPVHLFDNQFGGHGGGDGRGLSELGRRLVLKMNEVGMILDTAHSNTPTLRASVELSRFAPLNTHTGVKAVKDHWRNLSDEDVRIMAEADGVIGIMFGGMATKKCCAEEILDHMQHVIELVGDDHVALGSDWDGYIRPAIEPRTLPQLTERMVQRGWSEERIVKILGENVLRIWAARDRAMGLV
ncbi:MAG: dipeptidase [Planctomycetota bacterium]|jgi:membrane dipeptidase